MSDSLHRLDQPEWRCWIPPVLTRFAPKHDPLDLNGYYVRAASRSEACQYLIAKHGQVFTGIRWKDPLY